MAVKIRLMRVGKKKQPSYRVVVHDHFWGWIYEPIARIVERIARLIGLLQQGRITQYLLYSFVTLLALLVLVRR